MTWRIVVVNRHSKLSYQNNSLLFEYSEGVENIHLSEIHTIVVETTDVVFTTALIAKLVEYKVKLIFCDAKRLPTAELVPYYGSHDTSRSIAAQIRWNKDLQKWVWTEIIRQKIQNQSFHLEFQGKSQEAQMLETYLLSLTQYDETNREGHSAKVYFNALFGMKFTRDTENDINAALDYGYTLLLSVFSREIVKNGNLTQLGLKHSNVFNPFNLASDLMEPFRPLVDEMVFAHQDLAFSEIKYCLFSLFNTRYLFNDKEMYLVNIVESYVRQILNSLNEETAEIPVFQFLGRRK